MRMRLMLLLWTVLPAAAATCDSLATLAIPHATIGSAAVVAANGQTPAYCRVAGTLKPSADSDIRFEVWMAAENWNGKFEGVGNGGFAGTISTPQMALAIRRGYATAYTDSGQTPGRGTGG